MGKGNRLATTKEKEGRVESADTAQAEAVPRTDLEQRLERLRRRSEEAVKKTTEKRRRRFFDPL